MTEDQKVAMTLAATAYLRNLQEQTSADFVLLVKKATKVTALISKMHNDKASEEEIQKFINDSSKDIGLLTMLTGHRADEILKESDKFYAFMVATANKLVDDKTAS